MLKLGRRVGEMVIIDGKITVTVLGVDERGKVELAFDAPKDVEIDRFEVHLRKIRGVNGNKKSAEVSNDEEKETDTASRPSASSAV